MRKINKQTDTKLSLRSEKVRMLTSVSDGELKNVNGGVNGCVISCYATRPPCTD